MATELMHWFCRDCDDITVFEQPPCADGHAECPEWCCVECGSALLVGSPLTPPAPAEHDTARVA